MKRYWWVNHKQTARQEIAGNYLWSPKTASNGARNQFYDNMRLASRGDAVLSFAKARIAYVGEVGDLAIPSLKPEEFGNAGKNWGKEGWLLPVSWTRLMLPVRPKDLMKQLAPLLPAKYSPINIKTGGGNQNAYLAEIDASVYDEIMRAAGVAPLAENPHDVPATTYDEWVERSEQLAEKNLQRDESLSATEKTQLSKARIGQGDFRRNLEQLERGGCRITGVQNPQLLRASHIKPWRLCKTSHERLDGCNGLLLAPHVDLLFDRGLFTISEANQVIVSPRLDSHDLTKLGLADLKGRFVGEFLPPQKQYLTYHRETIFRSELP